MVRRLLWVLATSYCLVFFSELLFGGGKSLPDFLATWLFYSLVTYLFLAAVAHFHINNPWSLFLAGALYGWLTEGVLVQTVYESLPISLSATGLSWHALISVMVGWYALRHALLDPRPVRALLWSGGIGLFAGLWLPFWAFDRTAGIEPFTITRLAGLLAASVPALILSYWLQNRLSTPPFTPHRIVTSAIVALLVLQFVSGVVPAHPVALAILPLLLLIVYLGLRSQRQHSPGGGSYLPLLARPLPWRNLLSLLMIIPASLLAFTISEALHLVPAFPYLVYAITVPAGGLILVLSLAHMRRAAPNEGPARTAT